MDLSWESKVEREPRSGSTLFSEEVGPYEEQVGMLIEKLCALIKQHFPTE